MVLDGLPVGVCVVNRERRVILWNEGAERVTGYLRQDVLGRSCEEVFLEHFDDQNNALTGNALPLVETLREGHCVVLPASLRRKSGQAVTVLVKTVPVRGETGRMEAAAELFEEIGQRSSLERRHAKLAALGCLDTVTGILNHSMIHAHLQEALSLYRVYPVPFCALCISIDGLTGIRERFGQAAVDATLHAVAQALEGGLRPTDFVGRWLNEEFLAVLTECTETEVLDAGERLRRALQRTNIRWWGDNWHVSISMGAAPGHDQDTVGSIVNRAEQGMRESSEAGGNRLTLIGH